MSLTSTLMFVASTFVGSGAILAIAWLLREARVDAGQRIRKWDAVAAKVGTLETELEHLRKSVDKTAAPAAELPVTPLRPRSINFEARGQITRLARRGETAESIASMLRMPLNQVTLAIKAQRAYLDAAVNTGAGAQLPQ